MEQDGYECWKMLMGEGQSERVNKKMTGKFETPGIFRLPNMFLNLSSISSLHLIACTFRLLNTRQSERKIDRRRTFDHAFSTGNRAAPHAPRQTPVTASTKPATSKPIFTVEFTLGTKRMQN